MLWSQTTNSQSAQAPQHSLQLQTPPVCVACVSAGHVARGTRSTGEAKDKKKQASSTEQPAADAHVATAPHGFPASGIPGAAAANSQATHEIGTTGKNR
jgi:hypothetical protein